MPPKLPWAKGRNRPILLKKSTMASAAEKYVPVIEIFTFGRSFRTQISRSSVQKRRFNQSMTRPFGRTDFFNRIGQKPPVTGIYQKVGDSLGAMLPSNVKSPVI
ncbi:hypothetical protein C1Y08_27980 [Pseudomonas sp. FW306-02-F02-AA]|uniref:Uncharacterized protein n=2 Tax=Pseudomonas TaxID=286 RepID=A0A0N7H146_PSEFL|nr:hypothetical protein AO353_29175 [Pseudomonas fluorescens]PMZ05646.1 hypothetical protein C1Y07_04265 [Pseudomonas sp. FW306-02-F02-AB]PMZ11215.1 hypothetical protein C1Y06_06050 [Pseudomonas sp. FW306-02-H06C]PMZ12653.1 hypothetical protein C1Y08_27980 [Pseudomonas sp. FW306-02-F02-AA]PMZ23416.1 hypothetical protein C1Y09_04345 [Pseudomonas sp. FW306-02-F08-AA]PMZ29244.1 hypothetical protein C1Y05_04750 [Pseudomonas sp. FW306-02-F04-BA]PMZ36581.1 hypothetical protein C1X99_01390 [Pseudomo